MANTYTTLTELFTATADAIRAKTGKTDSIVADNFPDEIIGIKTGNDKAIIERTIKEASYDDVEFVNDYAFFGCDYLSSISFPKCKYIGLNAFEYCTSLVSASFPVCTSIGDSAFANCSKLTSANFPVCTSIGRSAFYYCYNLTSVSFPACAKISNRAFFYCKSLTSASVPACISIFSSAFDRCHNLTSLYLTGSSLCTLSNSNAFTSTPIGGYSTTAGRYGSIYVPASLLTSYQTATNWTYFSSRFVGV